MPRVFAVTRARKHADHDQSDHGNRDGAGEARAPQTVSGIVKLATESKGGAELLTKVLEARGVSMKPVIGDMTPENGKRIYRGFTDDKYAREFIAGKDKIRAGYSIAPGEKLTPYTWGAGIYATSEWEEARSYAKDEGMVVAMQFAPGARIVQGEGMWTDIPGIPDDWSGQDWGKFGGTISDLHNAYWAAQGYDAIDLGREVIILNPGAVTVDIYSADRAGVDVGWPKMPGKSLKHEAGPEHDQNDHGSWARGGAGILREMRPKEAKALSRYVSSSFGINRMLRKDPNYTTEEIAALDSILSRSPATSSEITLYRGVQFQYGEEFVEGQVFTDSGFMSLSEDSAEATNFTRPTTVFDELGNQQTRSGAVLHITIPKGTQILNVGGTMAVDTRLSEHANAFGHEREWVLPRGASLEITKVEGDALSGGKQIYATLVPAPVKSLKHLDGEHDQDDHGSWASGITGGKRLPAPEFAAKVVAKAAESRGGKSGVQQLDLSNTSSFAEIKSASDKITEAIDKEMGKWPNMYAEPRVEPTEQQKFLKQFSDGADLMRNTLYSANEGEIGRNKDFQFFVATGVDGTTPVGTLVYRNFTRENVGNNPYLTGHEDKWMELTNIGTNGLEPGVGTRLVTQVLGAAAESGRGVWLNDPYDEAAGFYKELGFEMKYKQGDWIGYMEPETVQEWWKSYEAAGGK